MKILTFLVWILTSIISTRSYLYPTFVDVYNNVPYYGSYVNYHYLPPPETNSFDGTTKNNNLPQLQPLNILSEVPTKISNEFSVVPLVIVSAENLKLLNKVQIIELSKTNPTMRVKIDDNTIDCTPVANITLDKPLIVYSLRTNIMFPSKVEISDANSVIPIKVGAVMAPVSGKLYVSPDTPIYVQTVFAIPIDPFVILKKNETKHEQEEKPDTEDTISIESSAPIEPVNVTLLTFPDEVAAPVFQVDEEDDELVNRNPPIVLAPAGIVQSTQPIVNVQQFTNSKESELLTTLKEEANKKKI